MNKTTKVVIGYGREWAEYSTEKLSVEIQKAIDEYKYIKKLVIDVDGDVSVDVLQIEVVI